MSSKISEAQKRATQKYLSKFDIIRVRVSKEKKKEIKKHCIMHEESMNTFIVRAIYETIYNDNRIKDLEENNNDI